MDVNNLFQVEQVYIIDLQSQKLPSEAFPLLGPKFPVYCKRWDDLVFDVKQGSLDTFFQI